MIRRIVCLMLVPALLANQAAVCCAHSHEGSEILDHSARPHVHLPGEAQTTHSDRHHHGHSGEHIHSGEFSIANSETNWGFETDLPFKHDHDAIFFGDHGNLQVQSNRLTFEGAAFISMRFFSRMTPIACSERQTQSMRAGPFTPYDCILILQTNRLLL